MHYPKANQKLMSLAVAAACAALAPAYAQEVFRYPADTTTTNCAWRRRSSRW
jgi:hypothetical protein